MFREYSEEDLGAFSDENRAASPSDLSRQEPSSRSGIPSREEDILERAAGLVAKGWLQHSLAKDARGRPVEPTDFRAHSFCALGALYNAAGACSHVKAYGLLSKTIGGSVAFWNNGTERTQAEVVSKLREAAQLARQQANNG